MKKNKTYRKVLEEKMREIIDYDLKNGTIGTVDEPLHLMVNIEINGEVNSKVMTQEEFIETLFTPIVEISKTLPKIGNQVVVLGHNNVDLYERRAKMIKIYEEKARQELEYESSLLSNNTAKISMWIATGAMIFTAIGTYLTAYGILK